MFLSQWHKFEKEQADRSDDLGTEQERIEDDKVSKHDRENTKLEVRHEMELEQLVDQQKRDIATLKGRFSHLLGPQEPAPSIETVQQFRDLFATFDTLVASHDQALEALVERQETDTDVLEERQERELEKLSAMFEEQSESLNEQLDAQLAALMRSYADLLPSAMREHYLP